MKVRQQGSDSRDKSSSSLTLGFVTNKSSFRSYHTWCLQMEKVMLREGSISEGAAPQSQVSWFPVKCPSPSPAM